MPDDYATQRDTMITDHLRPRGITNEAVIEAMRAVPREAFVPDADRASAYEDGPLPYQTVLSRFSPIVNEEE